MPRLTAVVVGAGLMGRWHARYAERAGARIVAVVDASLSSARSLARSHPGAAICSDLEICLRDRAADVVHVCTPPDTHAPLAELALREGRHVLVEKPVAASSAATLQLVESARGAGRLLAGVHQMPFQRGFRRLLARRGELGELVRVVHLIHSAGGVGRDTAQRRELLVEMLPHPSSLLEALGCAPEPAEWALLEAGESELALAAHSGLTRVEVFISLRARPIRHELIVVGERATALVDLFHGYAVFESGGATRLDKLLGPFRRGSSLLLGAASNLMLRALRRETAYPGLRDLIQRFYSAVRSGDRTPTDAPELLRAAQLAERVRASWQAVGVSAGQGGATTG